MVTEKSSFGAQRSDQVWKYRLRVFLTLLLIWLSLLTLTISETCQGKMYNCLYGAESWKGVSFTLIFETQIKVIREIF